MYDILTLQAWIRALYDANLGAGTGDRLWIQPFAYNVTFSAFNGQTGNTSQQFTVNANADFVLTRISGHANIGAAQNVGNKTVPFVRVQCIDAGSQNPFFNTAVDFENFAANANPQRYLPYPRWMSMNTVILVQAVGYAPTAETYGIDLSFEGVSVREYSQAVSIGGGMTNSALR